MAWLSLLLKGKKVAGAIKSVKPQVKYTGTKSLIDKFKTTVEKVKSTPEVIKKKGKSAKEIHGFTKKHGGTKADEVAGATIKRNEASKKMFKSAQGKK